MPLHKDDPTVATAVEVGKHISPAPAAVEVATTVEVGKHISTPVAGRKE